jgi:hypothetical protein
MDRKTLLEMECRNHPYSILKQILVDKLALKNTVIIDPFAACLYSQGKSEIQKVFDIVFFLSVLDEYSGESNPQRTLPHPFHLLFRKGSKHNCLELKSCDDSYCDAIANALVMLNRLQCICLRGFKLK